MHRDKLNNKNNMEYLTQIIDTTISSFDFGFCAAVNILTYIIIKIIDEINGIDVVSTWTKRLIMLGCVVIMSLAYYQDGSDLKLIINSAVLAPVFWSWVGKPICDKLNIGYRKDSKD